MASLQIGIIQGTTAFSTTNRSGNINVASADFTLWSTLTQPTREGPDGSANCCTLYLPASGDQIPISVEGTATVLPTTNAFVMQGLCNDVVVFQTPSIPSPKTVNFVVSINQLLYVGPDLGFPCRMAGDWTWKIGPPGGPFEQSASTLLEINYVQGGPPRGPVAPVTGTIARPDFGGSYPVDLFRLFLPSLSDLPPLGTDFKTWDATIQYDSVRGAPAYVDNNLGGAFQLRRFIKTMFATVNCYDLAAITQLAVAMIQRPTDVETFDSRWIFCDGYGFIPSGPLIGWPQYPDCNSPYFYGPFLPYYPDPKNALRKKFANHTWIEVTNSSGARTVLDATHCLEAAPDNPSSGTSSRTDYLADNTDPSRGPYVRTYTYNPASRNELIGVKSVGTLPAFVAQSQGLIAKADTTSPQMVNNAPFDSGTVLGIVRGVVSGATILDTDTTVGSAGSQVLVTLSRPSEAQLNVEISNYERLIDAVRDYDAAKQSLQAILAPDEFLSTAPLGDAAIRTACSILFRRNAVVIRVFTSPLPHSNINELSVMTLRISKLLDAHTLRNAVQRGIESRPAPALRGDADISVAKGSKFSLYLDNVVDASPVRIAEVSDYNAVMSGGVGRADGRYDFYAVGEGKTLVTLCVANKKNLSISATEVWVTVTAGDNKEVASERKVMSKEKIKGINLL